MPPAPKPEPKYQHQEYPKMLYKRVKKGGESELKSMTAVSAEHEEVAAKSGWGDHPDTVEEGETVAPPTGEDPDAPPPPPGDEAPARPTSKPPRPGKK